MSSEDEFYHDELDHYHLTDSDRYRCMLHNSDKLAYYCTLNFLWGEHNDIETTRTHASHISTVKKQQIKWKELIPTNFEVATKKIWVLKMK